jgi:hypothetical protein
MVDAGGGGATITKWKIRNYCASTACSDFAPGRI